MNREQKNLVQKPLIAECFYNSSKCKKTFEVKYNRSCGGYTQRNNWAYWTEREEDKDKWICNECLISLYRKDKYIFWENITSEKKRQILRTYVNSNSLGNKRKIIFCDGGGCETSCCYGCKCCMEKSKIIGELTSKITELGKKL
jgi:hypothetical protein